MRTTATTFIAALAVTLGLLISLPSAYAEKPLDVDCDVLEVVIICADAILDANNVAFNSIGDLISQTIVDDSVFDQLNSLFLFCSAGVIDFNSASQVVSTIASCSLFPLLNDEIGD